MSAPAAEDGDRRRSDQTPKYRINLNRLASESADSAGLFASVTKTLTRYLNIHRGVLALARPGGTLLTAVSSFNRGQECRRLSLPIPGESSLFRQVAEHRILFTDEYFGLFGGSSIEHRLLIDEDTKSIAVMPLVAEGNCLGVVAYASAESHAFIGSEEDLLLPVCEQLAGILAGEENLFALDLS